MSGSLCDITNKTGMCGTGVQCHEPTIFVSSSLCDVANKTGMYGTGAQCHEPTILCLAVFVMSRTKLTCGKKNWCMM